MIRYCALKETLQFVACKFMVYVVVNSKRLYIPIDLIYVNTAATKKVDFSIM